MWAECGHQSRTDKTGVVPTANLQRSKHAGAEHKTRGELLGRLTACGVGYIHGYRISSPTLRSMIAREIYPNAPVVLVAIEIRCVASEPLTPRARADIKKLVAKDLPILRNTQSMTIVGQFDSAEPPQFQTEQFAKLFNRQQTIAASIKDDAVILETTSYRHFEPFRDLAIRVMEARNRVAPVDGFERIGLRYIDEIRAPHETATPDWSQWIDPRLVGMNDVAQDLGFEVQASQGAIGMKVREDQHLMLRFGPQEGVAIEPNGELRRPVPVDNRYFLCDIDSFWQRQDETPEFDAQRVRKICDDLHSPVRTVFESVVTERLRKEVFRNG